jgi:hypothetical protein
VLQIGAGIASVAVVAVETDRTSSGVEQYAEKGKN